MVMPLVHLKGHKCKKCGRITFANKRRYTVEKFVEKAKNIHSDKYDYSKVVYKNSSTKVCIICPEHGEFWQRPGDHLKGQGCPKCAKEMVANKQAIDKQVLFEERFIKKAKELYGDKYDYSKVRYINNRTKVCITCPIHGEFWQTPNSHLAGHECSRCGGINANKGRNKTNNMFIAEAKKVHGDRFDYSQVKYTNNHTKVCIICSEHGEFWQMPTKHLSGQGCPKCSQKEVTDKQRYSSKQFIEKAYQVHGDKYDYSKVDYKDAYTKVCIICPEHGEFWQKPGNHLFGQGCPKCFGNIRLTTESFIQKAQTVHGDKYDYSKVKYANNSTKVCIICPDHGEFWQVPNSHLSGKGCPECGKLQNTDKRRGDTANFIKKAREVHGDKYNYSKVEYRSVKEKVCIICPKHGEFWQEVDNHLQGHGCPKCACIVSKSEEDINDFINNTCGIETKTKDRSLLAKRLECDILIPSHKLAIEYNGLRWHSEQFNKDKNYHLFKTESAESKGYHLIHIFEDEWLEHKDIVLNKIRHFLGKDEKKPVIGARKCLVKKVSKAEAEPFLSTYHIQGFVGSTAYYGAFYEDKLVGVMTFKQEKANEWNLTRFATNTDYRLPGLASKIFKQFIKDYAPIEVKTFLDRRWSHGDINVYDKMGFRLVDTLAPEYRYVVGFQRLHKFGFRKQILHKKYGLPLTMTEKEMTEQLGFYRIWDCGLYKYVWKKENVNFC